MIITCEKCGYSWEYKGKHIENAMVTCPRCLRKTKIDGVKKDE